MEQIPSGSEIRAAREAAGLSLRQLAGYAGCSAGHLSQVENGLRELTPSLWEQLRRHIDRDAATDTVGDVRRRNFIASVAAASAGALAPEPVTAILRTVTTATPGEVTAADVAVIEQAAQMFMNLDLAHGGFTAQALAQHTLRWASELLGRPASVKVRARLCTAAALLGDRAGWSLYDSGQSGPARRLLAWSLNHAAHGTDPDLRAHIMLDLSTVLTDAGSPDDGVALLRMAAGDERVSPAERANLHTVCARHCGTAGDRQAGLRHLGLAAEAVAGHGGGRFPEWAGKIFLSAGHLASAEGLALFELGEDAAAAGRLDEALSLLSGSRARTVLRCRIRRAVLHLRAGETDVAAQQAREVFDTAQGVRSARVSADLAMLAQAADLACDLELSGEARRMAHHTHRP